MQVSGTITELLPIILVIIVASLCIVLTTICIVKSKRTAGVKCDMEKTHTNVEECQQLNNCNDSVQIVERRT